MPATWTWMPPGGVKCGHLRLECRVLEDQLLGDDAGRHDLAIAIAVGDKGIERFHALLETTHQLLPLGRRQDARHDVEWDQALGALVVAVDVEGDADPPKKMLGFELATGE